MLVSPGVPISSLSPNTTFQMPDGSYGVLVVPATMPPVAPNMWVFVYDTSVCIEVTPGSLVIPVPLKAVSV